MHHDLTDLSFVPASLRLDRRPEERVSIVALGGEIDLRVHEALRELLWNAIDRGDNVVVDLTGVVFLDSTALGLLVGALKRARERLPDARRPHLVVVAQPGEVLRTFTLTGLDRVLDVVDTRHEADAII